MYKCIIENEIVALLGGRQLSIRYHQSLGHDEFFLV